MFSLKLAGNINGSYSTYPIFYLWISVPLYYIVPFVFGISPIIAFNNELLPEPILPIIAYNPNLNL